MATKATKAKPVQNVPANRSADRIDKSGKRVGRRAVTSRETVKAATAARLANIEEKRRFEALDAAGLPDGIPEPPPGLVPDDPVYRAIWRRLVLKAKSDTDLAQWLIGLAKVREQAEVEAANAKRANESIPAYLRDHDPIIAMGLEQLDSGLADVMRRAELELPMSTLEQSIAKWIGGRRNGAPTTIRQGVDETAAALAEAGIEERGGGGG